VAVIDDLERRGWVVRARAADDRRRYVLHVAPAGRRALDDLVGRTREIEDRVLAVLTDTERGRLFATLDKLVDRVLANEP
jgi:DNA-binding MarR family transcriptional regulator